MFSHPSSPVVRLVGGVSALALAAGGGAVAQTKLDGETSASTALVTAASPARFADTQTRSGLGVNAIYRRTKQGVVDVTATRRASATPVSPFPSPERQASKAEGSGFVVDDKGDIVTNEHVVAGADSVRVKFADGRTASARIVGQDSSSDLAVLRVTVPRSELHPLTFGRSAGVQVGDGVAAIGSPFGLAGTLTTGVVSAVGRTITAPNGYAITGAIQTDAAINHGNSGGPLLDASGNVVGMNSQINSTSGDNSGVGFATPSDAVRRAAQQLIAGGKVKHPYLGVQLTDQGGGAGVAAVRSGSAGSRAGLRSGDVITGLDGQAVGSAADVVSAIQAHQPGDTLSLTVRRAGGTTAVRVTLGDRPS